MSRLPEASAAPETEQTQAAAPQGDTAQDGAARERVRRRWMLIAAAALLAIALGWRFSLNQTSVEGKLIRTLQTHGYIVTADDLYPAAVYRDTSIRALLPELELAQAVSASLAAGFPSDIERAGQVALYMVMLENKDVITLYLVDGETELGFVQTPDSEYVYPLWVFGGQT